MDNRLSSVSNKRGEVKVPAGTTESRDQKAGAVQHNNNNQNQTKGAALIGRIWRN